MSAHQNQRQRLQDVGDACLVLATGKKLSRREIFDGNFQESWHAAFMSRLMRDELIIKHMPTTGANPADIRYQAVDEKWFENLASDPVKLAEWYFKKGVIPTVTAPEPEPPSPPPDFSLATSTRNLPTPVQHVTFEAPQPEPEPAPQSPGNVGDEILKTLIMIAENVVYLRQRLETVEEKVDELLKRG